MSRLVWRGDQAQQQARNLAMQGVAKAAEHLRGESQRQVPHDEGILEATATVTLFPGEIAATVSYDTPYAARQHEELTWRHQAGRKAKYLEDPHRAERETMMRLISATIRRGL